MDQNAPQQLPPPAPPIQQPPQRAGAPSLAGKLADHAARMELFFLAKEKGFIWIPGAIAPQRTVDISKIGPALLVFQRESGKALKDTKNPHFGSKYADLASIKDACGDALDTAALKYNELLMQIDGQSILYSEMVHPESGQFIASTEPLLCRETNNPQAHGSALTYARRYNMSTILSIVADDDDGNLAAGKDKQNQHRGGEDDSRRNFRDQGPPPARQQADREPPREPQEKPVPHMEDTIQPLTAPPRGAAAKTLWALLDKSPVTGFMVEHVPQMQGEIANCAKMALQTPDVSPQEAVMLYGEVLSTAHAHICKMNELGAAHWNKLRAELMYARFAHFVTHKLQGHEKMAAQLQQYEAGKRRKAAAAAEARRV